MVNTQLSAYSREYLQVTRALQPRAVPASRPACPSPPPPSLRCTAGPSSAVGWRSCPGSPTCHRASPMRDPRVIGLGLAGLAEDHAKPARRYSRPRAASAPPPAHAAAPPRHRHRPLMRTLCLRRTRDAQRANLLKSAPEGRVKSAKVRPATAGGVSQK